MATTILLVRHAAHDRVDSTLCGRMPGVTLGGHGQAQARALAARLARDGADAVLTSPVERARQTAAPIAARLGLRAEISTGFEEIDFGAWMGRSFASLDGDPDWLRWNTARGSALPPGGEGMAAVQARAMAEVARLADAFPGGRVVVVSHGDVIRAVLAALLGLPLDGILRFEVAPASVSAVAAWPGGGKVIGMNEVVAA